MRKLCFLSIFIAYAFGMEFGQMGSQSFGMAGTGVAVKNNPWGAFYNPSITAFGKEFKIALYGSVNSKDRGYINHMGDNLSNEDNSILVDNDNAFTFGFTNLDVGAFSVMISNKNVSYGSLNNNSIVEYNSISMYEFSLSYAYLFETIVGNISIGMTNKYMFLSSNNRNFVFDKNTNMTSSIKNLNKFEVDDIDFYYGLDLGLTYNPVEWFNLGFVVKNVNSPSFNSNGKHITINPQFRAGISFNWSCFTLSSDIDLIANSNLLEGGKSQLVSVGAMFDFEWISLRSGISYDIKNGDSMKYAFGLGFTIFDIGIQYNENKSVIYGKKIPSDISVQLGLGFSF